mmetsp:Transcript_71778/g.185141  ORF Transcript_71778/g.185141 Transcript_71778/m.185141 type:complete len:1100 (-) Transcript_71778:193-3492(-)
MLATDRLRKPACPWCTVALVLGALFCQICVLMGNVMMAEAMNELGKSTAGWSRVGLGVARSLREELDIRMTNVSSMLLESLEHVTVVQESLDMMVSLVGNTTDEAIAKSPELSLLQKEGPHALALLQGHQSNDSTKVIEALTPVVISAVHNVLAEVSEKVFALLDELMVKLKPALEQVGKWILQFGDKIQAGIDAFSATLDKVQKLFDQIMAKLNGKGNNEDELLEQVFHLFDVSGNGFVETTDLHEVAELYSITALAGNLSEELVKKYDTSGDFQLDQEEIRAFMNDPRIPGAMSMVLRTYARRLSEVGGQVASARQRDEVSKATVNYFALACAKNMTRVAWLSERLGNRSLPLAFTSDVLAQLCLLEDNPDKLTSQSIGKTVIGHMYEQHPNNTMAAFELMSNTSFWVSEGFRAEDQPECMSKVADWITSTTLEAAAAGKPVPKENATGNATASLLQVRVEKARPLLQMLGVGAEESVDLEALQAMPQMCRRLAHESVNLHHQARQHQRTHRRNSLFHSETSKEILHHLMGGRAASDGSGSTAAEQAVRSGQPAAPETLAFASWLAANATGRASDFQKMCFDFSSESSNSLDSFALQIQGMVSHVQGFIDMMMKYATPSGIEMLETTVKDFAEQGINDVVAVVERKITKLINASAPKLDKAIHHAAHQAGDRLGQMIADVIATPLGAALTPPLQEAVSEMVDSPEVAKVIGEELGKTLGNTVANLTQDALAGKTGDLLEQLVDEALSEGGDTLTQALKRLPGNEGASLTQGLAQLHPRAHQHTSKRWRDQVAAEPMLAQMQARNPMDSVENVISGAWEKLTDVLRALANLMPTAVSTLKLARKEVSKLSSNLDSIFEVFEVKGPAIFDNAAGLWKMLWTIYFIVLLPLSLIILYYGFWASGYFGGPMPLSEEEAASPATMREKMVLCLGSCTTCMRKYHDTDICFWSTIILMQVIVLAIFIVSILLCILGAIKAFVLSGCEDVYILSDSTICGESLLTLRSFLGNFFVTDPLASIQEACQQDSLLTCNLIQKKMMVSTILTTVFSILGTVLTLQMIIDSAILHEQARFRRMCAQQMLDEAADREDQVEKAAASSSTA